MLYEVITFQVLERDRCAVDRRNYDILIGRRFRASRAGKEAGRHGPGSSQLADRTNPGVCHAAGWFQRSPWGTLPPPAGTSFPPGG